MEKSFKHLRMEAGYSLENCATVFDVKLSTVKRWNDGKTKPPRAVFLCLMIYAGQLDFLGTEWRGFRILPDCIVTLEGYHIWACEFSALPYVYHAAGLERYKVVRSIKARVKAADYLPLCYAYTKASKSS